jgi:hypothetical protein
MTCTFLPFSFIASSQLLIIVEPSPSILRVEGAKYSLGLPELQPLTLLVLVHNKTSASTSTSFFPSSATLLSPSLDLPQAGIAAMDPASSSELVDYDDGEQLRVFSVSGSTSLFSPHLPDRFQTVQSRTRKTYCDRYERHTGGCRQQKGYINRLAL